MRSELLRSEIISDSRSNRTHAHHSHLAAHAFLHRSGQRLPDRRRPDYAHRYRAKNKGSQRGPARRSQARTHSRLRHSPHRADTRTRRSLRSRTSLRDEAKDAEVLVHAWETGHRVGRLEDEEHRALLVRAGVPDNEIEQCANV